MATLGRQAITPAGTEVTYVAASVSGDKTAPGARTFLHVVNGGSGSTNVTLTTPGTVDGLAIEDRVVAVPNGESRMISLGEVYRNRADNGLALFTCDPITTVTVAVLSI